MIPLLILSILDISRYLAVLYLFANIYAIFYGEFGKKVALLSMLYSWSFYYCGTNSNIFFLNNFLGSLSLIGSILVLPLTLVLFYKGKCRIWGELLTIVFGIGIMYETHAIFLLPIIGYFIWILLVDLADLFFTNKITRLWIRRIGEGLGILFIGSAYYLHKFGQYFTKIPINPFWLYVTGIMAFSINLFF